MKPSAVIALLFGEVPIDYVIGRACDFLLSPFVGLQYQGHS
jgi:hypothetical protein